MGPSIGAVQRLKKDYQKLIKDPVPFAIAAPLQQDILEWHYVIFGAPETPYEGGTYHGKLVSCFYCFEVNLLCFRSSPQISHSGKCLYRCSLNYPTVRITQQLI